MAQKPSIPKGTRDFLPQQSLKRQFIFDTARKAFQSYGYVPIETPAMENLDTLLGKYGEEGDTLIYRILMNGEKPNEALDQLSKDIDNQEFSKEVVDYFIHELISGYESELSISELKDHILNKYLREHTKVLDSPGRKFTDEEFLKERFLRRILKHVWDDKVSFSSVEGSDFHSRADQLAINRTKGVKLTSEVAHNLLIGLDDTMSYLSITGSQKLPSVLTNMALRYDLTVPFARFVVQNQNELTFPFKRYQIQPVWRADRPQKGRYREFFQCDVDVIGSDSLLNEAELLCIIDDVFGELGLGDITIRLNNRKILSGIANSAGLSGYFQEMTVAIDKLDKIGESGVKEEMLKQGLPEAGVKKVLNLIRLKGEPFGTLKMLAGAVTGAEEAYRGMDEVKALLRGLPEAVLEKVELDLTLARGLNYYTGAIIEVGHPDFPSSICGGGRYDDLTGIFGLKGMSGVGVSFGADRIYDLMEAKELFPESIQAGGEVFFVNFGEKEVLQCLRLAADLRAEGIAAEVYPDAAKMKKQMKYADDKGFGVVVLIGEEELKNRTATVRNMRTGKQELVSQKELTSFMTESLHG